MASSNDDSRQGAEYGDQQAERGHGGETHQIAAEGAPRFPDLIQAAKAEPGRGFPQAQTVRTALSLTGREGS